MSVFDTVAQGGQYCSYHFEITPLQKGLLFKAEDWKFPVFTI